MANYLLGGILYLYFPLTLSILIVYLIIYESKYMTIVKMIISELPIGQLSEDKNFHEYTSKNPARYSLVYIPIGMYKLYLLTWTRLKPFSLWKILSLKEICDTKIADKEQKIEEITLRSYDKYSLSSDDEKKLHIELLKDQCDDLNDREKVAQFKAGFYLTALTLVIAAMADKMGDAKNILEWAIYQKIVFGMIILYVLNVLGLLFGFASVKAYKSEKYSDFIDSSEKGKSFYFYWYKKFQRLQVYTDRDISFIRNIETYLKLIVLWSIAFTLILMLGGKEECTKNLSCQDLNLSCTIVK
jgi:hypothetical protein